MLSSSLFISSSNLGINDFKYLSQEFDSGVLDLVTQKGYMNDFEKLKQNCQAKKSSLTGKKKLVIMNVNIFFKFGIHFK